MAYRLDGLAALGDPTRRAIFELVAARPRAVVELADEMPVSRPAVSQHLEVRGYLEQFWATALESFKAIVEQPPQENP